MTEIHALVGKRGRWVKPKPTAGQKSGIASAPEMIADLPICAMLFGGKGYDATALRVAASAVAHG